MRLMTKLRRALCALILGVAATLGTAQPAAAAALSCTVRILTPTQLYTTNVYTLVEVSCNQSVSFIGGYVSLYRDGTHLGTVDVYLYNRSYAYKLNMVSCVPGNYHVMGYGFANLDGGAPDVAQRVTTPTVPITCT
jgi:hypothetical protein